MMNFISFQSLINQLELAKTPIEISNVTQELVTRYESDPYFIDHETVQLAAPLSLAMRISHSPHRNSWVTALFTKATDKLFRDVFQCLLWTNQVSHLIDSSRTLISMSSLIGKMLQRQNHLLENLALMSDLLRLKLSEGNLTSSPPLPHDIQKLALDRAVHLSGSKGTHIRLPALTALIASTSSRNLSRRLEALDIKLYHPTSTPFRGATRLNPIQKSAVRWLGLYQRLT